MTAGRKATSADKNNRLPIARPFCSQLGHLADSVGANKLRIAAIILSRNARPTIPTNGSSFRNTDASSFDFIPMKLNTAAKPAMRKPNRLFALSIIPLPFDIAAASSV